MYIVKLTTDVYFQCSMMPSHSSVWREYQSGLELLTFFGTGCFKRPNTDLRQIKNSIISCNLCVDIEVTVDDVDVAFHIVDCEQKIKASNYLNK